MEYKVLVIAIQKQVFKATDLELAFGGLTARQRTHHIAKMKDAGIIKSIEENGRTYYPSFTNNYLMRSLMVVLEREGFSPSLDK